jgi:hypothetical protein
MAEGPDRLTHTSGAGTTGSDWTSSGAGTGGASLAPVIQGSKAAIGRTTRDASTVYEQRPAVCRTFDCRVFAAMGPVERCGPSQQTPGWEFAGC